MNPNLLPIRFAGLVAILIAALVGPIAPGHAASKPHSEKPMAPPVAPAGVSKEVQQQPPVPLLWKLSDADNSVYLLGSFHVLKTTDYPLSTDVEAALGNAERVVFEVPPAELNDPALSSRMLAAARFGDDRTLASVLPAKLHSRLGARLSAMGSSIELLDAYEPWFVTLSLMMGESRSKGFSGEIGLDTHLMGRAHAQGKGTGGLETMASQLKLLDSTPLEEQISGLEELLGEPDKHIADTLDAMHGAWRSGDVAALDALLREDMRKQTPETYQRLNVERNEAWLPQVRAMLDTPGSDDVLVVVGAMHVLGPDGLVERLRSQGYRVERVCSACAGEAAH
ncbi:TraB/GumN family protein [Montanilutibacter psychrotolerans]|uniref:TraB/GumN family protein n=1 Tax=Montanilutibacter psychrotolerans TaxID=1327343 RepID=UPI001680F598|nr:TraB/GumN family protein [Lysobacter psychrotolerans]